MPDREFITQYEEITETLIDYGWIISPYMINGDFQKIHRLVLRIKAHKAIDAIEKEKYQNEINALLTDIIFHPLFRAFLVYRAKELDHLKKWSHHIERAVLHYYKTDYFSAVLCLLPAIEGILLSYYGWQYGDSRKPTFGKLILEIEKCKVATRDPLTYKLYSKAISAFLRKWIFSDTSTSDMTFSYLNRHYILHGMGDSNFYSIADTHRLIMLFDLFTEFFSIEQSIKYVFIPEDNLMINDRSKYYFKFIEKNIKRDEILKTENDLMKENISYVPEQNIPNWNDIVTRGAMEYLEFIKELDREFGKKGKG